MNERDAIKGIDKALMERRCDDCRACCGPGIGVVEADKAPEQVCRHLNDAGCAVYPERPQSCRDWHCLWRMGLGRNMERPDRIGYFLDITQQPDPNAVKMFVAREAWPGAFGEASVKESLGKLARHHAIILVKGLVRNIIGPPNLVARAQVQIAEARKRR